MIYQSAPAWSLKARTRQHTEPPTPSPTAYTPSHTLTKSPSWKIGKQRRSKQDKAKSPSPSSYHPPSPQKNNKMGVIGRDARTKQNVNPAPGPGPGSYHIELKNDTQYISFAKRYQTPKANCVPGPGNYNVQSKKDKRGVAIGKQQRFATQNVESALTPGPGNYQPQRPTRPSSANLKFAKAPRMSHQPNNNSVLGPGKYEIRREFDNNHQKSKGYTLGEKHYFATAIQTPGPADYSPTRKDLQNTPSVSFSRKYKEKQAAKSPSPNHYNPQYKNIIMKTESYSISKAERLPLYTTSLIPGPGAYLKTEYASTGAEISLGLSRKKEEKEDFPGPGAYNPNKEVTLKRPSTAKLGKSQRFYKMKTETQNVSYYDSKMECGSPKYSFSKKKRLQQKCQEGPGPGSYASPSSLCNLAAYASCKI